MIIIEEISREIEKGKKKKMDTSRERKKDILD